MRSRHLWLTAALLAAGLLLTAGQAATAAEVARITGAELHSRLGERGLVILDARQPADWDAATEKIAGAQRVDPNQVAQWAGRYAHEQVLIVYCS